MNLNEVRTTARQRMMPACRMCPVCNGVACSGEIPGMGGKGTGSTFLRNVTRLSEITLNMRVIHSVSAPDTRLDFFGHPLALPVLPAPVTGVGLNMGGFMTEGDYIRGLIRGTVAAGSLPMVGDSVDPNFLRENLRVLSEEQVLGMPILKPWNQAELRNRLEETLTAVPPFAVGIDVDAAGLSTMKLHGYRVDPKTLEELRDFKERLSVPFLVKGVMTVEDARSALEAGADAIVVSNHGGRVMDQGLSTVEVLPDIAAFVNGRAMVLADGGVRTGADVLKLLALGANAVLIGRPLAQMAIGGGEAAVAAYLQKIRTELEEAMVMTGSADLSGIRRESVNFTL